MILNKKTLIAAGITGWILVTVFGNAHKSKRLLGKKQQKKDIATWEGEGGNFPSSSEPVPKIDAPHIDAPTNGLPH